jgi:phage tail-like protein
MAIQRDRPYVQFNFLVDLGNGDTESIDAGFQEVSGIGTELTISEYRAGNMKENSVRKISGMNKSTDITLKRGIIGSTTLYQWLDEIRRGNQAAERPIKIMLRDETNTSTVMTWKLKNARITKAQWGPMNAKGGDIAMEEMTIAYERLEVE